MNKLRVKPIMGEPFDVTQMEQDLSALVQEAHDNTGTGPGPESFRRRAIDSLDRPSFTQGQEDHQQGSEELTSARRQTHGNFRDNARLSQLLKSVMRGTASWDHLDDVEKESLDMIALKISRVLSGKSLERQHWEDIGGYAHLALKECGQ